MIACIMTQPNDVTEPGYQHNIMLSVIHAVCRNREHYTVNHYAEGLFAECPYPLCYYAECRSANFFF